MTNPLTIALAQTPGSPHPEENLKTARRLTAEAADRGARLIVFPEMFMAIPPKTGFLTDLAEPSLEDGPFVSGLAQLADERDLHLVAGVWERIPVKRPGPQHRRLDRPGRPPPDRLPEAPPL